MTEEYLTIEQLGERLNLKPKSIRSKMVNGTFIKVSTISAPKE